MRWRLGSFAIDIQTRVGLDLGAGLDTGWSRIAPPATVDWYDVDYPAGLLLESA